jgi:hypothetical protein
MITHAPPKQLAKMITSSLETMFDDRTSFYLTVVYMCKLHIHICQYYGLVYQIIFENVDAKLFLSLFQSLILIKSNDLVENNFTVPLFPYRSCHPFLQ